MGFERLEFLLIGIVVSLLFLYFAKKYEDRFFNKVKMYWFMDKSKIRKFSFFMWAISIVAFSVAVGDLRGPEKIIESNISLQKTVVLIDSSSSMLAEDVRPNRFRKSGLIARHFVRNSFGHQVSLSVFSDIQKKIVPFTDDIEILESRLQTLMNTVPKGGSNLSLAIAEAVQYFKSEDGFSAGNILLLTDGEEHSGVNITVPDSINLAIVGVGSEAGGKIPLRRRDGSFSKYKRFQGQEVVSKLNKKYFEDVISNVKHGKVWFAQSYSLPTDEILKFFTQRHKEEFSKGNFRQRPVWGYPLIFIAIGFYIVSVVFSRFKSFVPLAMIFFVCLNVRGEQPPVENPLKSQILQKYKEGNVTKEEKLKLAEIFTKEKGGEKKAVSIYQKTLKDIDSERVEDLFNFGTALLKSQNLKDGIEIYKYLNDNRELPPKMKEVIQKHIQLAFQEDKKKKQQQKKDKQEQEKKNKDQKKKDQQKDQKDNQKKDQQDQKNNKNNDQNKKGENKKDQKQDDDPNKKKKDGKEKNKSNKDENKKDDKNSSKKKEKKKQQSWDDLKKQAEKKKKTSKVKGVLKQIMNNDGNLQRKFLDTSSEQRNNQLKDW